MSAIEYAKAQMKRGNIRVPHLTLPLQMASTGRDTIDMTARRRSEPVYIKREQHPNDDLSTSPNSGSRAQLACFCCRRRKQRCSKVESGAAKCDRCIKFGRKCVSEVDIDPYNKEEAYKEIGFVRRATAANKHQSQQERSMSPDSQLAAYQVRSPKKANGKTKLSDLDNYAAEIYDFDESDSPSQVPTIMPARSRKRKRSIVKKELSPSPSRSLSPESTPASALAFGSAGQRRSKKSSKGTWFYIEVHASDTDSDAPPPLMPGRTRGQARESSAGARPSTSTASPPRKRRRVTKRARQEGSEDGPTSSSPNRPRTVKIKEEMVRTAGPVLAVSEDRAISPPLYLSSSSSSSSTSVPPPPPLLSSTTTTTTMEKKKRRRRERRQTWEYISIDSHDEEEPSLIIAEGRAARRKSTANYKV